ncbi:hypothetical protein CPC735_006810 [Coccidioides posadasii C735 delta SOWgp]|uniref:Uncharacterized protein n=1 Tax=Coccidioides posadasii (strain C735) TaxID=222929 RepID=C5P9U7_COCP7|nr:hypothetical protein CPC735_006810 [Coccidioides posadasii C735 delta SOWgp]EER26509.1 hypothetical protein CPC735_006810 [Coccidioides posadasii C735 delta SOWgp]|eukprot:XP_003068654.1 hypothetical protein CPC735_006810 [Coccidioides posadasii C735 delta SOWgp]
MPTMAEIPWPPKSPHDALVSSPGGRRKFEEIQRRKHLARANLASPSKSKASELLDEHTEYAVDDDDDEETLQLKLAAIEARLKLKRLKQQNGTTSKLTRADVDGDGGRGGPYESSVGGPFLGERTRRAEDPNNANDVQVPLSPIRKSAISRDPISPRRVVLGIDKGLKGSEVSLRRPPASRDSARPGSSFSVTRPSSSSRAGPTMVSQSFPACDSPKIKSFSERLRETKSLDKAKWEKAQRVARSRSTGFTVDKKELEGFKAAAEKAASQANVPQTTEMENHKFSRADIMQAYNRPRSPLRRGGTVSTSSDRSSSRDTNTLGQSNSVPQTKEEHADYDQRTPDPSKFEPFSGLHLSNRILPHSYVSRKTETMKRLRVPDLLRTVKGPEFELPDTDGDYVVFGIVASKSTPREHKEKKSGSGKEKDPYDDGLNNSSKYMVLTLTDLKWSIDLFLFSTAFPKYYKMAPGTLVAILNPSLMPPPPNKIHTNAFSLTISSSEDTILEIGTAQDISFCKAVRKDGKVCDAWVDGRKTEFCDFHVDIQLRKTTAKRMEVNSGPSFGQGPRGGRFGNRGGRGRGGQENGLRNEGAMYDRSTGSTYYITPSISGDPGGDPFGHRSAAGLIDADNPFAAGGHLFHRRGENQSDRFRRRIADEERERNIAKRLGELKSVGSEYLRAQHNNNTPRPPAASSSSQTAKNDDSQSARAALGLDKLARHAGNIKLGRIRKRDFETSHGAGNNNGRSSPVKKTRFITAKGIREAGRESLGTNPGTYSDDDLDIVAE